MNRDIKHIILTAIVWSASTIAHIFGQIGVTRKGYEPVKLVYILALISRSIAGGVIVGAVTYLTTNGNFAGSLVGVVVGSFMGYQGLKDFANTMRSAIIEVIKRNLSITPPKNDEV